MCGHDEMIPRVGLVVGMRLPASMRVVDFAAAMVTISKSMEQTAAGVRIKEPKTRTGRRTIPLAPHTVDVLRTQRTAAKPNSGLSLGSAASAMMTRCSRAATALFTSRTG